MSEEQHNSFRGDFFYHKKALQFIADGEVKVFSLADIYGADLFGGAHMEDSGCIAGGYEVDGSTTDHYLVYVSTKQPVQEHCSPWNVVYKTNLRTGETERLTPPGTFDLSPSVSPSGKRVAVALFQGKRWDGDYTPACPYAPPDGGESWHITGQICILKRHC